MMTTPPTPPIETHRRALTGHCYRMLGSATEADDAVQETMVRAWKSFDRFEERASLKTWLYRIATNVCLDLLADRQKRGRPMDLGPSGTVNDPLAELPAMRWIEPIPDDRILPADADPHERAALRQSVRLAFVAALQHLPPKQRAVLLLMEVLGWSAAEVAESLETTVASVNSALARARATLGAAKPAPKTDELSRSQEHLLTQYVSAFERYDMDALAKLLHEEATLCMPPYSLWLRGRQAICAWMLGRGAGCRGSKLVPVFANGLSAFGQYHPPMNSAASDPSILKPWSLTVLEVEDDHIVGWNAFLDTATVFPLFGLPAELPAK